MYLHAAHYFAIKVWYLEALTKYTPVKDKEISLYGTRKCLNEGNLADILFYAN